MRTRSGSSASAGMPGMYAITAPTTSIKSGEAKRRRRAATLRPAMRSARARVYSSCELGMWKYFSLPLAQPAQFGIERNPMHDEPPLRHAVDPALIVILAGISAALHVGKLPPALPLLRETVGITLV